MTRICWGLVDRLSQMLELNEREAVRGDLAESGVTGRQALRDVLGLVVRRQAALWISWTPWIALVGLAVPLGVLLKAASTLVANGSAISIWMYVNNWTWGHVTNPGFRLDLIHHSVLVVMQYLTLACWSWTSGFALGALSRRTIWVTGAMLCLVLLFGGVLGAPQFRGRGHGAVFSLTFYAVIFPFIVKIVLVLLPSLWGMRQGVRTATLPRLLQKILVFFAVVTITVLAIRYLVWWQLPFGGLQTAHSGLALAVVAPLAYTIATASWRRWRGNPEVG